MAHLADWLVLDLGVGVLSIDAEQPEANPASLAEFRIQSKDLPRITESLRRLFTESDAFLPDGQILRQAV